MTPVAGLRRRGRAAGGLGPEQVGQRQAEQPGRADLQEVAAVEPFAVGPSSGHRGSSPGRREVQWFRMNSRVLISAQSTSASAAARSGRARGGPGPTGPRPRSREPREGGEEQLLDGLRVASVRLGAASARRPALSFRAGRRRSCGRASAAGPALGRSQSQTEVRSGRPKIRKTWARSGDATRLVATSIGPRPLRGVGAEVPGHAERRVEHVHHDLGHHRPGRTRAKLCGRRGSSRRAPTTAGRPASSGSSARGGGCRSRARRNRPPGRRAGGRSTAGWRPRSRRPGRPGRRRSRRPRRG